MKSFFFANTNHRARIGAIRTTTQRNLINDRRTIDQPADHADISPGERGVIENTGVLGLARQKIGRHLIARYTERFSGAIQVQAMTGLILNFCQQYGFALKRGRTRYPIPLG